MHERVGLDSRSLSEHSVEVLQGEYVIKNISAASLSPDSLVDKQTRPDRRRSSGARSETINSRPTPDVGIHLRFSYISAAATTAAE